VSSAVSSSSAATAVTASPTNRTLSRARACSSWLTGRISNGIGSSLPTSVARTPGYAAARLVSIRRMRAWGCGERRSFANAMRGRTRSSAKTVWPVTLAAASTLASGFPTTCSSRSSATHDLRGGDGRRLPAHPGRSELDGLEDLQVARAAAQVPGQGLGDLGPGGTGGGREQGLGREQETPRAVAPLGGAQLPQGPLHGMEA